MTFCLFDIETATNRALLRFIFPELVEGMDFEEYAISPDTGLPRPATDFERDQHAYDEFMNRYQSRLRLPIPPLPCLFPICISYGQVNANYELLSIENRAVGAVDTDDLVIDFWERYEQFEGCLVSFNGRSFDLPLLELHAMRLGLPAKRHMARGRDRYHAHRHLDLLDVIRNFAAVRLDQLQGGLDGLSIFFGGPGKAISGAEVQRYYEAGEIQLLADYCGQDVLRTYLVFLRWEMLKGNIKPEDMRAFTAAALLKYGGQRQPQTDPMRGRIPR